jgi:hypothetical protein
MPELLKIISAQIYRSARRVARNTERGLPLVPIALRQNLYKTLTAFSEFLSQFS